jgi:hypothetical protein
VFGAVLGIWASQVLGIVNNKAKDVGLSTYLSAAVRAACIASPSPAHPSLSLQEPYILELRWASPVSAGMKR